MAIGASVGMKVISVAIGVPVGIATRKAIARAWTLARPENPPKKPNEPDARWGDAIGWAALSGAGVVVAQLVTQASTRSAYRAITGNEPPPQLTKEQKKQQKAAAKAAKKADKQAEKASTKR